MNKANATKWVAALIHGNLPQTNGYLERIAEEGEYKAGFCCLGVGCKVAGIERTTAFSGAFGAFGKGKETGLPPQEFYDWLGVEVGSFEYRFVIELSNLNDNHKWSLAQIGEHIRAVAGLDSEEVWLEAKASGQVAA